jgi:acetyl esterase/lipase
LKSLASLASAAALAALFACEEAERVPSAPPLGASLVETLDASPSAVEEAVAKLERIETCDVPAYMGADASGPAVIGDVAYGDDDHQRYDLALPEGMPKLLVVIIHGGGWTAGAKSLYRPTIRSLAAVGYAAASVEYRLARDARRAFPAGLADVRCGIRAVRLRTGMAKLVVIGASAGGHLAAMVANGTALDGECSDRSPIDVRGAVLYYAPLELDRARERYIPKMRQAVDELLYGAKAYAEGGVDETSQDWGTKAREATPRHAISARTPPTVILHGRADNIVPVDDARDYAAALSDAGVPALVVELPDQSHGFPMLGRKLEVRPATCTLLHFLEQIASE